MKHVQYNNNTGGLVANTENTAFSDVVIFPRDPRSLQLSVCKQSAHRSPHSSLCKFVVMASSLSSLSKVFEFFSVLLLGYSFEVIAQTCPPANPSKSSKLLSSMVQTANLFIASDQNSSMCDLWLGFGSPSALSNWGCSANRVPIISACSWSSVSCDSIGTSGRIGTLVSHTINQLLADLQNVKPPGFESLLEWYRL